MKTDYSDEIVWEKIKYTDVEHPAALAAWVQAELNGGPEDRKKADHVLGMAELQFGIPNWEGRVEALDAAIVAEDVARRELKLSTPEGKKDEDEWNDYCENQLWGVG